MAGRQILVQAIRASSVAIIATLATSCAASTAVHPSALRATSTRPADAVAHNKDAATQEAGRLLSLVQVPSGAVALRSAPPGLDAPALGTPEVSSLIDKASFWKVPLTSSDLVSWLHSHPPQGHLTPNGTASSGGPDYQTTGLSYDDGHSDAWQSAELDLGVTDAAGGQSFLRADAVLVWLDPRPNRDATGGNGIHFSVSDGCRASDRGTPGVANAGSDLDKALLPPAVPSSALICHYAGLNGHPFALVGHQRLDSQAAAALARRVRQLPLSHADRGVANCPNDDGSAVYLAFDYASARSVVLVVALGGCSSIANGHIRAAAGDVGQILRSS